MTLTTEKLKSLEEAATLQLQGRKGSLTWEEIAHPQLILQMVAQLRVDRKRRTRNETELFNKSLDMSNFEHRHPLYKELNFEVGNVRLNSIEGDSVLFWHDTPDGDRRWICYEYSHSDEDFFLTKLGDFPGDDDLDFVLTELCHRLSDNFSALTGALREPLDRNAIAYVNSQLSSLEQRAA